jgi:uncharacterized protein
MIYSSLGGAVTEQGITIDLSIHRLEDRPGWAMEVVNQQGTSTVWHELFETDEAAFAEFRRTVDQEGMREFLDDDNVVPFKR